VRERLDALKEEIGSAMTASDRKLAILERDTVINQFQGEQRRESFQEAIFHLSSSPQQFF